MTAGGLDREDNWHDIDYVPLKDTGKELRS